MQKDLQSLKNAKAYSIPADFQPMSTTPSNQGTDLTLLSNGREYLAVKTTPSQLLSNSPGAIGIFSQALTKFPRVQQCLGIDKDSHSSSAALVYPFSLHTVHLLISKHKTEKKAVPESIIARIYTDVVEAGVGLQRAGLWHPKVSSDSVFHDTISFCLTNPFLSDDFLSQQLNLTSASESHKQRVRETRLNENVRQLGIVLLQLSSLAEEEELVTSDQPLQLNKNNVRAALKLANSNYDSALPELIETLLKGNFKGSTLTFESLIQLSYALKQSNQTFAAPSPSRNASYVAQAQSTTPVKDAEEPSFFEKLIGYFKGEEKDQDNLQSRVERGSNPRATNTSTMAGKGRIAEMSMYGENPNMSYARQSPDNSALNLRNDVLDMTHISTAKQKIAPINPTTVESTIGYESTSSRKNRQPMRANHNLMSQQSIVYPARIPTIAGNEDGLNQSALNQSKVSQRYSYRTMNGADEWGSAIMTKKSSGQEKLAATSFRMTSGTQGTNAYGTNQGFGEEGYGYLTQDGGSVNHRSQSTPNKIVSKVAMNSPSSIAEAIVNDVHNKPQLQNYYKNDESLSLDEPLAIPISMEPDPILIRAPRLSHNVIVSPVTTQVLPPPPIITTTTAAAPFPTMRRSVHQPLIMRSGAPLLSQTLPSTLVRQAPAGSYGQPLAPQTLPLQQDHYVATQQPYQPQPIPLLLNQPLPPPPQQPSQALQAQGSLPQQQVNTTYPIPLQLEQPTSQQTIPSSYSSTQQGQPSGQQGVHTEQYSGVQIPVQYGNGGYSQNGQAYQSTQAPTKSPDQQQSYSVPAQQSLNLFQPLQTNTNGYEATPPKFISPSQSYGETPSSYYKPLSSYTTEPGRVISLRSPSNPPPMNSSSETNLQTFTSPNNPISPPTYRPSSVPRQPIQQNPIYYPPATQSYQQPQLSLSSRGGGGNVSLGTSSASRQISSNPVTRLSRKEEMPGLGYQRQSPLLSVFKDSGNGKPVVRAPTGYN